MQLRIFTIAVVVAWSGVATAQTVVARTLVYDDSDATTVVTSTVDGEAELPGDVTLGAHALIDVISTASVDVVSAATGRWDETRVEVGGRAGAEIAGTGVSLGVVRSQENDWRSNAVVGALNREFFQRNTSVQLSYGWTGNAVGRAEDPNFEESLTSHRIAVGVGQLLDRNTRIGVGYSAQFLSGFLSSPYRYVSTTDGFTLPETHPGSRTRHALSARLVRAVTSTLSAHLGYRLYRDDWGITSHTFSGRLAAELGSCCVAGAQVRGYVQDKADFYRATYAEMTRYMTNDRELTSFWDVGGTVDVAVRIGPVVADARAGHIQYRFREFARLPSRSAWIIGAGARMVWE